MKADNVVLAAELIDQLNKLDAFLRDGPDNADTMTITFRKGSNSKSLTLRDQPTLINTRQVVKDMRETTYQAIIHLGVDFELDK